ncbi:MAG: efflux RND transporter periplasmic adaptor subunit, partial [Kiritimatiellia bacterium]|nr:efflux RND transporter periplasmic adaptor subunit [Lentisphaerota bacterium]
VEKARGQAALATAALAAARVDLERCTIVSPVTGYTGRRQVDAGNVVAPGGQTLLNIRDTDKLYLDFTLSESNLPELRQALAAGKVEVLLFAEAAQGLSGLHQGDLKLMENTVDTDSGTVMLRALVDNSAGQLWPGQFVYVYPILRTISQAVIVPLSAVAQGKAGPYAYVVKDGKAELRALEQGPVVADAVVITSGVAADEDVVTTGQLGVWPGAALQIKTEPDDAVKGLIERRMADPDVKKLIHVLTARGETPDQIGLILGIPADRVQSACETQGQTP